MKGRRPWKLTGSAYQFRRGEATDALGARRISSSHRQTDAGRGTNLNRKPAKNTKGNGLRFAKYLKEGFLRMVLRGANLEDVDFIA